MVASTKRAHEDGQAAAGEDQAPGEQASRDGDLGKLERDIATVAHDLGADLDQLLAQSQQCPLWVKSGHSRGASRMSAIGGKADIATAVH